MNSARQKVRRLESFISAFILVVLVLIAVTVFIRQSNYDMGRFGITDSNIQSAQTGQPIDLATLVRRSFSEGGLAPPGFDVPSKPALSAVDGTETYDADNLYEKIDGKAPLYTESGFEKLYTRRFANPADPNLSMELYIFDMGNIKNAFSVYSLQRRADAETLPAFDFAYRTANALYFVHGRYYAEIIGFSESTGLSKAMLEVSQNIQTNLPVAKNAKIHELAFFPEENLVAGNIKLYLANAFGFEGLTNTFTAVYKINGQTITAFFSKCTNRQDAETIAENYYNFLIANGGVAKTAGDNTFTGKVIELDGAAEIIFTTGSFVGGIHEAESRQTAENLSARLLTRLSQIK